MFLLQQPVTIQSNQLGQAETRCQTPFTQHLVGMLKLGWIMDCSYQAGQLPRKLFIAGGAFKRILVWLSFLTSFLPFAALAFQRALSAGKDEFKCSKQSKVEGITAAESPLAREGH